MRIAVNGQFLNKSNTGIGQYLINTLSVLLNLDTENEYLFYLDEPSSNPSLIKHGNIRVVPVSLYRRNDLIRKAIWEKYVFPRAVKKDKVDLVWSPYLSISRVEGIRHIMTIHDVVYRVFPQYITNSRWRIYYKLAEKAARRVDEIITVSECSKKDIVKFLGIDEKKIKTIYLGRPARQSSSISSTNRSESKYIFYIGGFDYRKNVDGLLKAFSILIQYYSKPIRLVIAGRLPESSNPLVPDVKKIAHDLGIDKNVEFVGYVEEKDLPGFFQNAELFIFPTLYEGFGLPVLEAMSFGCPVISSQNSSIVEISGGAAKLVNPSNPEKIARAMEEILKNENMRKDMSRKGLKNADRFSWEKCARETLEIFKTNIN